MKDYITPVMIILYMIIVTLTVIQDNRSQEPEPDLPAVQESGVRYVEVIL